MFGNLMEQLLQIEACMNFRTGRLELCSISTPHPMTTSENFYVYGNSAYAIVSYNTIVKSDFASNTAPVVYTVNTADILDIGGNAYFLQ